MMEKNVKGNKGFSLITVIITVAFIGILGLLVLYLALQNFNMKITGIKGKDSFYTAEQALEEIRLGLQQDVGDAMSAAYIKVMEDYNKQSSSSDEVLDELRQKAFETAFFAGTDITGQTIRVKKARQICRRDSIPWII